MVKESPARHKGCITSKYCNTGNTPKVDLYGLGSKICMLGRAAQCCAETSCCTDPNKIKAYTVKRMVKAMRRDHGSKMPLYSTAKITTSNNTHDGIMRHQAKMVHRLDIVFSWPAHRRPMLLRVATCTEPENLETFVLIAIENPHPERQRRKTTMCISPAMGSVNLQGKGRLQMKLCPWKPRPRTERLQRKQNTWKPSCGIPVSERRQWKRYEINNLISSAPAQSSNCSSVEKWFYVKPIAMR